MYHGKKEAEKAEDEFNKVFKNKELPSDIPQIKLPEVRPREVNILDLLIKTKLVASKSEAKRLILQKGVKINSKVQENWQAIIEIKKGLVVQIGRRKFVKII